MDVQLTEVGATSILLDNLPGVFPCLQWHSAEVLQIPPGASCLATSPDCAVQAMAWGPRAWSAQFHIEVEPNTVQNWARIKEYAGALDKALVGDGATRLEAA